MENENKTKQDCGCGDGCCTPSKSKLWMKILFAIIIIAAIAIVSYKLVNNNTSSAKVGATIGTEKSGCCDSSKTKSCESGNKSCCPENKN